MISIGWKNMRREPIRMCVAICGVIFAVVLVTVEVGMLLGLARNASILIDNSKADLWISAPEVKTFDFATPFSQRKKYLIESIPGVGKVEEYNISVTVWKLPNGGNANCQVVAFDVRGDLAPRLNIKEGYLEDLHNQNSVIIDEGSRAKLGNPKIGDYVEILRSRARIVGFTSEMQSFSTMPFVFTSLPRGETYGWQASAGSMFSEPMSIYLLVKVKGGQNIAEVKRRIESTVPGIDVYTNDEFSWKTRRYWLVETGVGIGFLVGAILGLLVGGVIVSQTLYGMTVDKLPEFGVLKAMGASMRNLCRIVIEQAVVCGAAGILFGLGLAWLFKAAADSAGTVIELPWQLQMGVSILAVCLCCGASLVSIFKLNRIEPAMVFRA